MCKTLGFRWLIEVFCPASAFSTADSDEVRNPQRFTHVTVTGKRKKRPCYLTDNLNSIFLQLKNNVSRPLHDKIIINI